MNKKKILIIEDDAAMVEQFYASLGPLNHDMKVAEDGETALSEVDNYKPDLIILDIILPKIDGLTILEDIKKSDLNRNIPVIVVSNIGGEAQVKRTMDMGAADYFFKGTMSFESLVSKVRALLN